MNIDMDMERWKALAEILLKNDERVFIEDIDGTYYFADIILIGEDSIIVQCFEPEDRKDQKFTLYWPLVKRLKKYEVGK